MNTRTKKWLGVSAISLLVLTTASCSNDVREGSKSVAAQDKASINKESMNEETKNQKTSDISQKAESPSPEQTTVKIGGVEWYTNYDTALKVAKLGGKPMWLHFGENPG